MVFVDLVSYYLGYFSSKVFTLFFGLFLISYYNNNNKYNEIFIS
jgi:hypothetical protein